MDGPCVGGPTLMQVVIVSIQMVQSVAIAYISLRAHRKNREDFDGHRKRSEEV